MAVRFFFLFFPTLFDYLTTSKGYVRARERQKRKKFKESVSYRRSAINLFLLAVAQVGVSRRDPSFARRHSLHNRHNNNNNN
jgi:hypothetical protein